MLHLNIQTPQLCFFKNHKALKEKGSTAYSHGGKKKERAGCEEAQTLELVDKTFKLTIWKMLNRLKEVMAKELKKTGKVMSKEVKC